MAEIEIDDEVYEAIRLPDQDRDRALKTELAVSLYDRDVLSFGKARSLADLSAREFHRILGERQIKRHYTGAELDEDRAYARR